MELGGTLRASGFFRPDTLPLLQWAPRQPSPRMTQPHQQMLRDDYEKGGTVKLSFLKLRGGNGDTQINSTADGVVPTFESTGFYWQRFTACKSQGGRTSLKSKGKRAQWNQKAECCIEFALICYHWLGWLCLRVERSIFKLNFPATTSSAVGNWVSQFCSRKHRYLKHLPPTCGQVGSQLERKVTKIERLSQLLFQNCVSGNSPSLVPGFQKPWNICALIRWLGDQVTHASKHAHEKWLSHKAKSSCFLKSRWRPGFFYIFLLFSPPVSKERPECLGYFLMLFQ